MWSIKQLISSLEKELLLVISDSTLSAKECLLKMLNTVLDACEKDPQLFKVLLTYLIQLQKSGVDVNKRVERRVIRMSHLMSIIIIRGQKNGEFQQVSIKYLNNLLYTLLESVILRISVLGKKDLSDTRESIEFTVNSFCVK